MATIVTRGNKFSVVYNYTNEKGETKQKWESRFSSEKEANIRKREIEFEKAKETFISPSDLSLEQFLLQRWVPLYSKRHWGPKMYTSSIGLIKNHILPHLGSEKLQSLTSLDFEQLFDTLSVTEKGTYREGVRVKMPNPDNFDVNMDIARNSSKYLSPTTINEVYDLLKSAFSSAVEWKLLREVPLPKEAPKKKNVKRQIWDNDTMKQALSMIRDPILHLGVHLAFICSLRNGETVGITLDSIHLSSLNVEINKTMERIDFAALKAVPQKDIIKIFPNKFPGKKSCLVLKGPKTEESNRNAIITEPLALEIHHRIEQIKRDKQRLGDDYNDYNLLLCLENGDPIEPQLMLKWFDKWQTSIGNIFPRIVFHGLRHSATTYKIALSGGDIKSVQGDGGWTSLEMVNNYSHVQEASRRRLSQKLQADFYDLPEIETTAEIIPEMNTPITGKTEKNLASPSKEDLQNLVLGMLEDPEMKQTILMALLANNAQSNKT